MKKAARIAITAIAFVCSSCVAVPRGRPAEPTKRYSLDIAPISLFEHDGASIKAFVFGDTNAEHRVLFIHGWSGSGAEFIDLANKLVEARPDVACFSVDLPGSGSSDKPADAAYDIPYFRAIIREAVAAASSYGRETGIPAADVTLVGHSLGGHFCADYAANDGAGIGRLVLLAPAGWPGETGAIYQIAATNDVLLDNIPKLITEESYLHGHRLIMAVSPVNYSEAAVRYAGRALATPEGRAALVAVTLNALEHDCVDESLGSIKVPVVLAWGRNDAVLPFSYSEKFMSRLPAGTRFLPFDHCGHMPHSDRSAELAAMLSGFIGP